MPRRLLCGGHPVLPEHARRRPPLCRRALWRVRPGGTALLRTAEAVSAGAMLRGAPALPCHHSAAARPAGRKFLPASMKALIVAGTASGVGKTTVTLALLAALRERGLRVQPFKAGPDFIDPGHHEAVSGVPSRTLDGWMVPPEENRRVFWRAAGGRDVAIVEGMMGLFDGVEGGSEEGSSAALAKALGLPVVLVIDAGGAVRSAAAMLCGFRDFDPGLRLAGVI